MHLCKHSSTWKDVFDTHDVRNL